MPPSLPPTLDVTRLLATVCQDCFYEFVREFWEALPGVGPPEWNWHIRVFCEELEVLARYVQVEMKKPARNRKRRPYDLICNVSPGTTKSSVFSVLSPAWVWTFMPEARFICASHTDSLVLDLASRSRQVIRSAKYQQHFPHIQPRSDQEAKGDYANTLGGERKSCTVACKSPTGRHAFFVIIDDPMDPKKAISEAELKTADDFMTQVIPDRKVDKRVVPVILVMQRLGLEDPTSVMERVGKRPGAVPIRKICLPAVLTEDVSPLEMGRCYTDYNQDAGGLPNGLMDPVRLSPEVLDEVKARSDYGYACQFLQNPRRREGGLFREQYFVHRVKAAPYDAVRVRYWDLAATVGESACSTAGTLMAYHKQNLYVENV